MEAAAQSVPEASSPGWQARLRLTFGDDGERTVLRRRAHVGPLVVQRPFYPEGGRVCHVYVLHPPGGLVAGDALAIEATVEPGAHALLTTPAAGKVYRSANRETAAAQRVTLTAAAGATVEWLPQETILFDGAQARLSTTIDLAADARFVGWEIICLGRPAAGEVFRRGWCRQAVTLSRAGRPLCMERALLEGDLLASAWGMRAAPVTGTMLVTPPADGLLETARALGGVLPADDLVAATMLDGALVCRYLGGCATRAREHFARVWAAVRPAVLGRAGQPPRIWST